MSSLPPPPGLSLPPTATTTSTATTANNSNNNNNNNNNTVKKPQNRKPKEPKQPKPQSTEPTATTTTTTTASTQQPKPKPEKKNNNRKKPPTTDSNTSTTTTTTSTTTNTNTNQKQPGTKKQHNHNHQHNHQHIHQHNHQQKKDTKNASPPGFEPQHLLNLHKHFNTLLVDNPLHAILKMDRFKQTESVCILCCDPITFYSKGECDHTEVCATCVLRQRELYKEFKCCICKTEMKQVIFTQDNVTKYAQHDLSKLVFNKYLNVYFESAEFETSVAELWHYKCRCCDAHPFENLKKLEFHLKIEHKKVFCEICLKDRKVFLPEQDLFDPKLIPLHLAEWNGGAGEIKRGKKGHPPCRFCNLYFYGDDQLYDHLVHNHFTCFICEGDGILYQYFSNYTKLRQHFIEEHFPCDHPSCLEKKFIVFRDDLALKQHEISTHLDTSGMSKNQIKNATTLNINFRNNPSSSSSSSVGSNNNNSVNLPTTSITTTTTTTTTTTNNNNYNRDEEFPEMEGLTSRRSAPKTFNPDFKKKEEEQDKKYQFTQEEIEEKNRQLISKIQSILDEKKYALFKQISQDFKNGKLQVNEYYSQFMKLFGKEKAFSVFDDLVFLLPDENKRVALVQLHTYMKSLEEQYPSLKSNNSNTDGKKKKKTEPVSLWAGNVSSNLEQVKRKPVGVVYTSPFIAENKSATTTTTTTTTNNSNSMVNRIQSYKQPQQQYFNLSGGGRGNANTRHTHYDDSDDEDYVPPTGQLGVNGYFPSGITSTTNFSTIQVTPSSGSSSSSSTTNAAKMVGSKVKPSNSDFPSLPTVAKKPKETKQTPAATSTSIDPPLNFNIVKQGKKGKKEKVVLKFN